MERKAEMGLGRRDFLRLAGMAALTTGLLGKVSALAGEGTVSRKPRMAVQMYSVRDFCAKDFVGTLKAMSSLGFSGVEFAGYYGFGGKPEELKKILDDLGLTAAGTHIGTGSFRGDSLKRTIDFHQKLGCKYLIVPNDKTYYGSIDGCKKLAELFNQAAEILEPLGMKCGYHNHTGEFKTFEGKTCFDIFAENTSPKVVLQQDCGWSLVAGQDPVALIRKYPGRFGSLHFKPTVVGNAPGKKAYFGQDSVNWKDVLAAARATGGTEWAVLEQERYPDGKNSMECTTISAAGMKALLNA